MLNILLCIKRIQEYSASYTVHSIEQLTYARDVWERLATRPDLAHKVAEEVGIEYLEPLSTCFNAKSASDKPFKYYRVCGIDGSQIYPDRHEGFTDYIINRGTACFTYDTVSSAHFASEPFLFSALHNNEVVTNDYVNAQRAEYELEGACLHAVNHQGNALMIDGTLIIDSTLAPLYCHHLAALNQREALYIGYVSASHSRQLIKLLQKAALLLNLPIISLDYLVDTDVIALFLKPGYYTQPFKDSSAELDIHYVYLHVESEIARVELPSYTINNPEQLLYAMKLIIDQCHKGDGYPLVLAEAHEQAVITSADRESFYTLLRINFPYREKISLKRSKKIAPSV